MYIAIDVGGTHTRVAAFASQFPDEGNNAPACTSREFDTTNDFEADIREIFRLCDELAPKEEVEAVGIAVAGRLDPESKRGIVHSSNLHGWHGKDISIHLMRHYTCPHSILNDAQSAGLGEAAYGLRPLEDFWFVIWSSGVGGALVHRIGMPVVRPVSYATELGHQRIADGCKLRCKCGQYDCLEAYVGGKGIASEEHFGVPAEDLDPHSVAWRKIMGWMATGLRNLVTIQPTPLIVFGGAIACNQHEKYQRLDLLHEVLKPHLKIVPAPRFQLATLGEDAGLYGALAAASEYRG